MKSIFCIKYNKQLFHLYFIYLYFYYTINISSIYIQMSARPGLGILSAYMMDFIKTK